MAQAQQLMADEFAEMEALVRREEPYGGAVVRLARERHEAEESVAPLRLRLRHADEEVGEPRAGKGEAADGEDVVAARRREAECRRVEVAERHGRAALVGAVEAGGGGGDAGA